MIERLVRGLRKLPPLLLAAAWLATYVPYLSMIGEIDGPGNFDLRRVIALFAFSGTLFLLLAVRVGLVPAYERIARWNSARANLFGGALLGLSLFVLVLIWAPVLSAFF